MTEQYTIDNEFAKVVGTLEAIAPLHDDYEKTLKRLELLSKIKATINGADVEKTEAVTKQLDSLTKAVATSRANRVSPDTVVLAVTNILGIVLILNFEQLQVVSSKALGFVLRR